MILLADFPQVAQLVAEKLTEENSQLLVRLLAGLERPACSLNVLKVTGPWTGPAVPLLPLGGLPWGRWGGASRCALPCRSNPALAPLRVSSG